LPWSNSVSQCMCVSQAEAIISRVKQAAPKCSLFSPQSTQQLACIINAACSCLPPQMLCPHDLIPSPPARKEKQRAKGKRAKVKTSPEAATQFSNPPELNADVSCHFRDAKSAPCRCSHFHATLSSDHSSPITSRLTSPDVPSSTQSKIMQRNKEKEIGKSCTAKHVSRKETEGLLWMLLTNDVENVVKGVQTSL
jgi:hypothetical protein